jgi:hypothetical protein
MFFYHSTLLSCTAFPRETFAANYPPSQAGSLTTYRINGKKYRITSHLRHPLIYVAPPLLEGTCQGKNWMNVIKE